MTTVDIRPFQPRDAEQLVKNAQEDNHALVVAPNWVYEKNGEIVGYYSIAVPAVLSWQHTKKMHAMDSIKVLGHIEGQLGNFPMVLIPCDPASPYMGLLPKQGYQSYFKQVHLFLKEKK